jgi:anti-anti-sigma factor
MLFLAPLFSGLPKAVLGALIIEAVVMGMMDVAEMRRLRHVARTDFWIAIAAILGVLSAGVLAGVIIGILLSIIWLVYISATPNVHELGRKPGTQDFRGIKDHPGYETYPGLLVLRFDAGLFFASVDSLVNHLIFHHHQAEEKIHTVVLDFEGINFIDSQGAATLSEMIELAHEREIEFRLTRVKTAVKEVLHKDGIIDQIGEENIYANVYEAAVDKILEVAK